jgi:hypothetical protein
MKQDLAVEQCDISYDCLELPCIPQRILNSHRTQLLLLISFFINIRLETLVREVYPSIFDKPASTLSERDNGAFTVEEEEIFG